MKKVFLLTIEDWNEESPDDDAWIEFITSSLDGGSIDVKCEVFHDAKQSEPNTCEVCEEEGVKDGSVCPTCGTLKRDKIEEK